MDFDRIAGGILGGLGDFASTAGNYAMKSMFEQEAQKQSAILQEGIATRGREQAHGMAKELEGSRQTFEATQNEERNKTSIKVAGISAAAQIQTTAMNNAAMADVRREQAAQARADTTRLNLGNEATSALNKARDEYISVQNNPNATPDQVKVAQNNYFSRDPDGAYKVQLAASSRIEADGKVIKNEIDRKAADAQERMVANKDNPEEFAKAREDFELYNPLAKANRVTAENQAAEARKRTADAVIDENIVKARQAAATASSPEERRKAEELLRIWTQTPKDEMTNIALWQAQAKSAEVSANHVATEIQKMQQNNIDNPERMAELERLRNQYIAEGWDASEKAKIMLYRMAGITPPEGPKVGPETFNIDPVTGKGTPTGAAATPKPKPTGMVDESGVPIESKPKKPGPAIPEPPKSLLDWSKAQ